MEKSTLCTLVKMLKIMDDPLIVQILYCILFLLTLNLISIVVMCN